MSIDVGILDRLTAFLEALQKVPKWRIAIAFLFLGKTAAKEFINFAKPEDSNELRLPPKI